MKLPSQLNNIQGGTKSFSWPDPSKILAKIEKVVKDVEKVVKEVEKLGEWAINDRKDTAALKKAVKKQDS